MRREAGALLLAASFLVLAVGVAMPAAAQTSARVSILFDLGDGTYHWSERTIRDRLAPNASWDATLEGAAMHGLQVDSRWYGCCGIAVSGILAPGWSTPPAGFAALYVWDEPAGAWALSNRGISDLVLEDGDAIAWSNAGFDSQTFEVRQPVPTPRDLYPVLGFRADGSNTGDFPSIAPNGLSVLWDRDVGVREIAASPAVAYGRVYVLTMDGLFALDANTGEVRWTNPNVRGFSSPTVFDGSLVVGGRDGRVYRVNATNGAVQWSTTLLAQPGFSGITSSPRVVYDWVYVGTFNETGGPGELVSLWASNGTVAWRIATGSIHYSTPAFTTDRIVVGVMGRYNATTQVTFDPPYGVLVVRADGTDPWFFPTSGPVAASPVIRGTLAIVPTRSGDVYAVDWLSRRQVWRTPVSPSVSSAALHGDTVYVGAGTFNRFGGVHALNASTGEYVWSFDTNGGPVQSSVAYADGKVFFSTNLPQGAVFAVNASAGRLVWSYTPIPADYILGSPVIWNGTVYAPSDNGHVYAIRSAGEPLASLTAGPVDTHPYRQGSGADVFIRVTASRGRLTNARLLVTVPSELILESVDPNASRRSGNELEWDFAGIPFNATERVVVGVRVGSVPAARVDVGITVTLSYSDDQGNPYPSLSSPVVFPIAGALEDPLLWIGVAAAAFVAVALIAYLVIRRRRRRESS